MHKELEAKTENHKQGDPRMTSYDLDFAPKEIES